MKLKKLGTAVLAIVLSASLFTYGCSFSTSQFEAVLNQVGPAVAVIIQIVSLLENKTPNLALSSKISSDVSGVEKLYSDWQTADATSKLGIQGDIQAGFTALNSDLSTVFSIAQVSDPASQAKIAALISLIQTGVGIAEALVPSPTPQMLAKLAADKTLTADNFVVSYNRILTARTGNLKLDQFTPKHQIHIHSGFVRAISFGVEK